MRRNVLTVLGTLALVGLVLLAAQEGAVSSVREFFVGLGEISIFALKERGWIREPWEVEVPRAVRRLAAPGAKAFADQSARDSYVDNFSDGFKSGLTDPEAQITRSGDEKEIGVIAFQAGRAAALSGSAAAKKITLRDYDYQEVTTTGTVVLGFENSGFAPTSGTEVWWLELTSPRHYEALRPPRRKGSSTSESDSVVAKVKGFLSPPKQMLGYGHMGGYPREIVVSEVIEVHFARPPDPP